MTFKEILIRSLTWWNGQTWGTALYTWRKGERVGQDEFGNTYYRAAAPLIDPSIGPQRRWVVYNGEVEASRIPPVWRGWLSYTHNVPPTLESLQPREWELPHRRNMTGTPDAYRPQGSTVAGGHRPAATGDYLAWSPDGDLDEDVPQPNQHPGTHGVGLGQAQHG
jgi:NADH:ubiquinone oxidoreductase subunit